MFVTLIALEKLQVDKFENYTVVGKLSPNLVRLSLTTSSWNCKSIAKVVGVLSEQAIALSSYGESKSIVYDQDSRVLNNN